MEAFAVAIEEGVLALLHIGTLHLLGGAVALRNLHPVADAAHVELRHRRALAWVDVFGKEDHIKLAVLIDDVAFA